MANQHRVVFILKPNETFMIEPGIYGENATILSEYLINALGSAVLTCVADSLEEALNLLAPDEGGTLIFMSSFALRLARQTLTKHGDRFRVVVVTSSPQEASRPGNSAENEPAVIRLEEVRPGTAVRLLLPHLTKGA
jgi:hypothetical protein